MNQTSGNIPFGCGQCLHCRINKAREWQCRILLESFSYLDNCFVTLTYNLENYPVDGLISKRELQLFLKRLRKKLDKKIRYFGVGEYGKKSKRPHYHVILFNVGVDKKDVIEKAWNKGFILVGDVNKNSARYMTGYVLKGWNRKDFDLNGGIMREFMISSKQKGGIGFSGMVKIAESIKNSGFKDQQSKVIRSVKQGKNKLPIGGYLTKKLSDELGFSSMRYEELIKYMKEFLDEYSVSGKSLYKTFVERNENKRVSQVVKSKIFNQRRSI